MNRNYQVLDVGEHAACMTLPVATTGGWMARLVKLGEHGSKGRTGLTALTVAPALFFVACLMLGDLTELDWAFGFISYTVLKLFTVREKEVHWMVWLIGGIFLFKFICIGGH